jgi:hypothetical protein
LLVAEKLNTKQKILPFFPLGVFLFPGEDLPLRIFEPRYLQLIEEAKENGITFGIPFKKDNDILEYGCEVKLQQVIAENDQGKKVISVKSVSLFRVNSYTSQMSGKLYAGGSVEILPPMRVINSPKLINLIIEYTDHYDKDFLKTIGANELRSCDIVRSLKLSSEDKYNFLLMNDNEQREYYLLKQIQYLMLIRKQEKMLNDDFHLN